jgi:hypothetical protein
MPELRGANFDFRQEIRDSFSRISVKREDKEYKDN